MSTETFNLFSAVIQLITLVVLAWAARTAIRQFRAARHNTWAQAFYNCLILLQEPKVVQARSVVFSIGEEATPLSDLTPEQIASIDLVCRTYDAVGMMAQWGMIPQEIIIDSWCDSIRRLWPICESRVRAERTRRKADEFWDDFEWLHDQAKSFDQNRIVRLKHIRSLQSLI